MAATQIVIKSRENTEFGFPKKLGLYLVGEARQIGGGSAFNVSVDVLRESEMHLPRPPIQLQAESEKAARELAVSHYRELAERLRLDIWITELPRTGAREAAAPQRAAL